MTRRAIRGNSYASGRLWPPFLPSQPVDVTHSDGFYQHDEQQREGGRVVIEDVKPVVASLHGEYQADDAVNETHDTCVERAEHTWESNCEGKHAVLGGCASISFWQCTCCSLFPSRKAGPSKGAGHQGFAHTPSPAVGWALTRDDLLGEAAGDELAVGQGREDGGGVSQHAADAQHQEHDEVEHGVQLRHLHVFDGFRVDDKR